MRGSVLLSLGVGVLLLLVPTASSEEKDKPFQSGPQVGREIPGPLRVYNLTGIEKTRDKFHCLVCDYGLDPAIVVFARAKGLDQPNVTIKGELGDAFEKLLTGLDRACLVNGRKNLHAFVVFVDDDLTDIVTEDDKREVIKRKILAFADQVPNAVKPEIKGIPNVPLCLDNAGDPALQKKAGDMEGYDLNGQAAVTVVLFKSHRVVANYAFRKNELTEDAVKSIIDKSIPKLLDAR